MLLRKKRREEKRRREIYIKIRTTQTLLLKTKWCVLKALTKTNSSRQAGLSLGWRISFSNNVDYTHTCGKSYIERCKEILEKKFKLSITSPRSGVSPKRANLTLQTFPRKVPSTRKGSTSLFHVEKIYNFAVSFAGWQTKAALECTLMEMLHKQYIYILKSKIC